MITLNEVSFDFAGRFLYLDASLDIYPKERIGIVGHNGTGKSTLLRLLNKEFAVADGEIIYQKGIKISFFNQDLLAFESDDNIVEVVRKGLVEEYALLTEIDEIAHKLETGYDEKLFNRLIHLQEEADRLDAYTLDNRIKKVLAGLGFKDFEFEKSYNMFSGGWRMRVMLAKCILEHPDVLMLDEPTNHLDLPAIQWLEQYITSFEGTVLVVSHDRYFLNRACNRIVEIDQADLISYTGNYDSYLRQKAEYMEQLEKTFNNQQAKLRQEERFIERFRSKASKAKAVQSRIKLLEKRDLVSMPEVDQKSMNLKLTVATQPGKIIAELKDISKKYPNISLFKNSSAIIERGDKIALIGANGKGKSTLLRLVFGSEAVDTGHVKHGHNVKAQFFAQHQLEQLQAENSILEEMQYGSFGRSELEIRTVLGSFLFSGDEVGKKIRVLSGGERSRVALAKIIMGIGNFLLLDEPTNHLDMQSVEILVEALNNYQGTYIAISHDRFFLSQIANKIWYIENEQLKEYPGTYEEYELQKQRTQQIGNSKNKVPVAQVAPKAAVVKKPVDFGKNKELTKELTKLKKQLAENELEVQKLNEKKMAIELQMADEKVYTQSELLKEKQDLYNNIKTEIVKLEEAWEMLFLTIADKEELLQD